jgi:hypothetical protein
MFLRTQSSNNAITVLRFIECEKTARISRGGKKSPFGVDSFKKANTAQIAARCPSQSQRERVQVLHERPIHLQLPAEWGLGASLQKDALASNAQGVKKMVHRTA